ncbi:S41 family peptidase [Tamlana sp. 2_MG-2023]|uniref:S41 family peptidase n=1 Tax=unclassified Tamlana TaxID=2614803 RepID=UPI0026E3455F|nr:MULTISPECIES: S41 family peptidase [unclassified Tamlana]MDO6760044.1 S41 family peptidase [Tamlana sp. 2_MG-2023]MDO6790258.1 S41 family peptidase [Tamlana sp. 1_MG-2023]
MNRIKISILILCAFLAVSCFEDLDDHGTTTNEINDFVWSGMNLFYLYKDDVPDLANNRFTNTGDYRNYLDGFSNPEDLFESLIYNRQTVDRFSWIVDDYIALEESFKGISMTNGMEFQLYRFSSTDSGVFGVITHILPDTNASSQGLTRGDVFYAVDGTALNISNYSQLLSQNSYSIELGLYDDNDTDERDDDSITPLGQNIALTKFEYSENPIYIHEVLSVDNRKIGYLMYNGFTGTEAYNNQLNNVFADFKAETVNDLVLDLRYNSGGSVNTAILLSSMITGQFKGDIFCTEQWNSEFQAAFEEDNPEQLINRFVDNNNGAALHSLNLSKVYILTTERSASASELVINALIPYIQVVQIGTTTAGKYQASTTIYDSPDFGRQGANPGHTYAMQPLIYKSLNVDGVTDYFNGLPPSIEIAENILNLGILGDVNEPLLAAAISDINGTAKQASSKSYPMEILKSSNDFKTMQPGMHVDKILPSHLKNQLNFE